MVASVKNTNHSAWESTAGPMVTIATTVPNVITNLKDTKVQQKSISNDVSLNTDVIPDADDRGMYTIIIY